jgi:hypothetical protein
MKKCGMDLVVLFFSRYSISLGVSNGKMQRFSDNNFLRGLKHLSRFLHICSTWRRNYEYIEYNKQFLNILSL